MQYNIEKSVGPFIFVHACFVFFLQDHAHHVLRWSVHHATVDRVLLRPDDAVQKTGHVAKYANDL